MRGLLLAAAMAPALALATGSSTALAAPAPLLVADSPADFATRLYREYLRVSFAPPSGTAAGRASARRREMDFRTRWLTRQFQADFQHRIEETDADPVTLSQDTGEDWAANISARVLSQTAGQARVLVTLGAGSPAYQVLATLQQEGGMWRLARVAMSPKDAAAMAANARPSKLDMQAWSYAQTVSALTKWATRKDGDMVWTLVETGHCRFRERFASHLTVGDRHAFSQDYDFSPPVQSIGMVQQNRVDFTCANGATCASMSYSDNRGGGPKPWRNFDIQVQDGKGPDVVAAIQHLSVFCR